MAPLRFYLKHIRYYISVEPPTVVVMCGLGVLMSLYPRLDQILMERAYTVSWE